MGTEEVKKDYDLYKVYYENLQKEVYDFLLQLKKDRETSIDISGVTQRPNNKIKDLDSIIKNINERPEKYEGASQLTDIKDIAGDRITCHCQIDREILFDVLEGELKQRYIEVTSEKKDGMYRAYHFNFAKSFEIEGSAKKLYCEIQLRTVLGDAWAIQDTKYVYKNKISEGEPQILSKSISDILNSCESLWDLVKIKSREDKDGIEKINKIREKTDEKVKDVKKEIIREERKATIDEWFSTNRNKSLYNLNQSGFNTFMEIRIFLPNNNINKSSAELRDAAQKSTIPTFGWPIGIYVDREEYSPKPVSDGIVAELDIKEDQHILKHKSYDYWSIKKDGSFYLLKSLFEDSRKPGYLFFDTRIIRITEVLMYARNLYFNLGIGEDEPMSITIKHGGIKDRIMSAAGNRLMLLDYKTAEDEYSTTVITSIKEINENIVDLVVRYTTPFFELFNFFKIGKDIVESIVNNYVAGKIT